MPSKGKFSTLWGVLSHIGVNAAVLSITPAQNESDSDTEWTQWTRTVCDTTQPAEGALSEAPLLSYMAILYLCPLHQFFYDLSLSHREWSDIKWHMRADFMHTTPFWEFPRNYL